MAPGTHPSSPPHAHLLAFLLVFLPATCSMKVAHANLTLKLHRRDNPIKQRHVRQLLDADKIDLKGSATTTLFAELKLGNPPRTYHPQIDTMSELLWLNCDGCTACPTKSDLAGVQLTFYKPGDESKRVRCGNSFCSDIFKDKDSMCMGGEDVCRYKFIIDDGGGTSYGYFVNDTLILDHFNDDGAKVEQTVPLVVGCGVTQTGSLRGNNQAVDGILGLGHDNSSFVPQLAASSNIKKVFSHCLTNEKDAGGIFVVGQVDIDLFKKQSAAFDPKRSGYTMKIKGMDIGGKYRFDWSKKGSEEPREIDIDIAASVLYIQDSDFEHVIQAVINGTGYESFDESGFVCFTYSGSLEPLYSQFPGFTFILEPKARWTVTPKEYLFQPEEDDQVTCLSIFRGSRYILSGPTITNKIMSYDLEENTISWMDESYNCQNPNGVKMKSGIKGGDSFNVPYTPPSDDESAPPPSNAIHFGTGKSALLLVLCTILFSLVPSLRV